MQGLQAAQSPVLQHSPWCNGSHGRAELQGGSPNTRGVPRGHDANEHASRSRAILDTGCRTAAAGKLWHVDFQRALEQCGMEYFMADYDEEIFRFGAGDPVLSTKAYIYPVQIYDHKSWVRIALVENTSTDSRVSECPGLVDPAELARWKVQIDFATSEVGIHGTWRPPDFGFAQYGITPESQAVAQQAFGRPQAAPAERSTLLRIGSRCPGQHL